MLVTAYGINGDCFEVSGHSLVIVDIGPKASPPHDADIVLLTHDDDDHVSGAANYFRNGSAPDSGKPGELWVPYEWGVIARVLIELQNYMSLDEYLSAQGVIAESDIEDEEDERLRALEKQVWPPKSRKDTSHHSFDPETAVEEDALASGMSDLNIDGVIECLKGPKGRQTLGGRMITTAKRTATILKAAYTAGWRVRYFNHCPDCPDGHWRSEGLPGVLTMISATEMRLEPPQRASNLPPPVAELANAAYLTVWNKRSLVSYAWESEPRSCVGPTGMLLWADAAGPEGHPLPNFYITSAPHHGSHRGEHDEAWQEIVRSPFSPVVVSTFNSSVRTPRPEFLSWPPDSRACVACWRKRVDGQKTVNKGLVKVETGWHPCNVSDADINRSCSSRGC